MEERPEDEDKDKAKQRMAHKHDPAIHTGQKQDHGGMGQVIKVYNNMFFNQPDGCDLRSGIILNVRPAESAPAPAGSAPAPAATTLVFADLKQVVQDADAHALAFGWKGTSSIKCCVLMSRVNIVSSCEIPRGARSQSTPRTRVASGL